MILAHSFSLLIALTLFRQISSHLGVVFVIFLFAVIAYDADELITCYGTGGQRWRACAKFHQVRFV